MKKLRELLSGVEVKQIIGRDDVEITGISCNSKDVKPGFLFVAIKGAKFDGNEFIGEALERGAVAFATSQAHTHSSFSSATIIITENPRKFYSLVLHNYYDRIASRLKFIGVTGTNGKTTTVYLIKQMLDKMGLSCGLFSTVKVWNGKNYRMASMTTPDPLMLLEDIKVMVNSGIEYCVMEVSSHALDQHRVDFIPFIARAFTNITHDHLDYHGTFINYLNAKKRFFDAATPTDTCILNRDDTHFTYMIQNCKGKVLFYSMHYPVDFHMRVLEMNLNGMVVKIEGRDVVLPFFGIHNGSNALCAYAVCRALGFDKDRVLMALSETSLPEGRLQRVCSYPPHVFVDYAHTPDAMEKVLKTLAEVKPSGKRLITVFGCGGNRDKAKRPLMGKIAATYSDYVIITSDNPRDEDPLQIIKEIKKGIPQSATSKVLCIEDRREAIKTALSLAATNDIVAILGKGHENYQEIKGKKLPFSDMDVTLELLKNTVQNVIK